MMRVSKRSGSHLRLRMSMKSAEGKPRVLDLTRMMRANHLRVSECRKTVASGISSHG